MRTPQNRCQIRIQDKHIHHLEAHYCPRHSGSPLLSNHPTTPVRSSPSPPHQCGSGDRPDYSIRSAIGCILSGRRSQTGPPSAAGGCIQTCASVLRAVPAQLMLTSRARLHRGFVTYVLTVHIPYSSSIIAGMRPIGMHLGTRLVIFRGLCLLDSMD